MSYLLQACKHCQDLLLFRDKLRQSSFSKLADNSSIALRLNGMQGCNVEEFSGRGARVSKCDNI